MGTLITKDGTQIYYNDRMGGAADRLQSRLAAVCGCVRGSDVLSDVTWLPVHSA